jgi:uncharacterized tellurite resistance protein B-like protein
MTTISEGRHAVTRTHPISPAADAVRDTLRALRSMEPPVLDHLDAVADTLTRIAAADEVISAPESSAIEELLVAEGGLAEAVAVLLVEMARQRRRTGDCGAAYAVTRGLRRSADEAVRRRLVDAMIAVAHADGRCTPSEIEAIRCIAAELGVHVEPDAIRQPDVGH